MSERPTQELVAYCATCKERQFDTPSGISCPNGHGGDESIFELIDAANSTHEQETELLSNIKQLNSTHVQEVCEYCKGTGNDLINSACEGFVACHVCGGKSAQEVEEQEVIELAEAVWGGQIAVHQMPKFISLASKLREKDAELIKTLRTENECLSASCKAATQIIVRKDEEIARLKDELLETQNRCVTWASTKGTILAMYENSQAELSASEEARKVIEQNAQGEINRLNAQILDRDTKIESLQAELAQLRKELEEVKEVIAENACFEYVDRMLGGDHVTALRKWKESITATAERKGT